MTRFSLRPSLGTLACFVCLIWAAGPASAADFHPVGYALVNARVIPAPGQVLENAKVIVRQGLIVEVGPEVSVPPDVEVIDVQGLTVYAGFIDAGCTRWVKNPPVIPGDATKHDVSQSALAATVRDNRKSLSPEFAAAEHLELNGDALEKQRQSGFTVLHIVPNGRLASGNGALLSTHSAVPREAVLDASTAAMLRVFAPGEAGYPHTLMGGTAHLRQAFLDARHLARQIELFGAGAPEVPRPLPDLSLESLRQIVAREQPAWFFAQSRDEIVRADLFAREHELPWTLWGGEEAYRVLDRWPDKLSGIILTVDHGDEPPLEAEPASETLVAKIKEPVRVQQARRDHWHAGLTGIKQIADKGLPVAVSSHGVNEPAEVLKGIRHWIQHGLSRDQALAALTRDAAKLVGQEQRLGTIEPGKLAHLVVLTGPFDDERSKVRFVVIEQEKFEYNKDAQPVPADAAPAAAKLELSGVWQVQILSGDKPLEAKLNLSQSGGKLSGSFASPQGDGKVTAGEVRDSHAEWTIAIGVGASNIELKFQADGSADKPHELQGTVKSAFGGETKFTATRQPPPANPVAIGIETEGDAPAASSTELPTELIADRLKRAVKTDGNLLIQHGTVLTGRGQTLPNTDVLIKAGKIAAIGADLKPDEGMHVLDATGLVLMPGIIDTHSHIMIGDGMGGVNEATMSLVPEVRVKDSVWTGDVSQYRALAGGVTTARLLHGSANVVGGQDAVVKMNYGAHIDQTIVYDAPQGVKFALGENVKFQGGRFPNTRMGVEATLNRAFLEALDYRRQWMEYDKRVAANPQGADKLLPPRRDLRLEALMDIVNQQKFIHSHCYRADEILMLLRIADGLGIRVWSLQHVLEGYKVAPEIKAHGASCSTFSDWWAYKVEAYDATPYNAALLHHAGINSVIKSDDWELIRHLYLEASKTLRYGNLTPDEALQTITYHPARELGLQDRLGSIEVGKEADIAIFNGHPLHAFSRCEHTVIGGEIQFTRSQVPTAMSDAAAALKPSSVELPIPAPEVRQKPVEIPESPRGIYALIGATVHPLDAPEIPQGTVLVTHDKIVAVGKEVAIPPEAVLVRLEGLHIYPGLIDAGTTLGLVEIGKVRETHDYAETGVFQPDLRAGVAVNPDSELIPVARSGGITTILATPTGGLISGQASAVRLGGWTAPEMIAELQVGLVIRWPDSPLIFHDEQPRRNTSRKSSDEEREKKRQKEIDDLKEFLQQGRLYVELKAAAQKAQQTPPIADPRYEALAPYLSGAKPVLIEAHQRRDIAEALLFAEQEKLKPIITGATDAWKLAAELKQRNVPVIIGPVMRNPTSDSDPFDAPYANAGRLHEAGVLFCFRSDDASNSRNVPFEAAMAVAYGLPAEVALQGVTLNSAKVLGLDQHLGSITPGKLANLIITDGSPLLQATHIKQIFVSGQPYSLENRQTRLYEKYRQRLESPVAN